MKVVMVLVIVLVVCHLASNFGGEGYGGGRWEKQRTKRAEIFDKNGADDGERRVGGESEPGKGEGGQVDVLEGQLDEEKSDTPRQIKEEKGDGTPQIDEEQGDNVPLILLWNNYQGDKSALYSKIFHR